MNPLSRVWLVLVLATPLTARAEGPDFRKDIAPLLERRCVRCHQPGIAKGGISIATPSDLRDSGYLVPGEPGQSELLNLVTSAADGQSARMPKEGKPLAAQEVLLLREWIAHGAEWPADVVLKEPSKANKNWWSLQPLALVSPPVLTIQQSTPSSSQPQLWQRNPIDAFIWARLAEHNLEPSPPAEPRTLLRRVTYDLTGLPPTETAVAAFEADHSDAAFESVVNALLDSPAYGEHWGRHWLDVVRFGESNGFERNVLHGNAWPFRDYVIQSFNSDKPYDQLVREHLAGDVVGNGDLAIETGLAFLVTGPYDNVGQNDPAQTAIIRANTIDEIVRATSEGFLGVTVGCARCHNHKFDPISQQDYHRFAAVFSGVRHGDRVIATRESRGEHEKQRGELAVKQAALKTELDQLLALPEADRSADREAALRAELANLDGALKAPLPGPVVWIGNFQAAPGPFHTFVGGDPAKPGVPVAVSSPEFIAASIPAFQLADDSSEAERRLKLAEWIVDRNNALTARVLANRIWGWHFGQGLVSTPSDFGAMGTLPSHPELLDCLAGQLHAENWHWKPIHRLICLSQTYRQSSSFRSDAAAQDGDSRLLWRFPPRRLTGEEIRDSILQVSGKLDRRMGGPGFRLYDYHENNVATYVPLDSWGPDTYRRAVYHQNARASRVDLLSDFDCPDPNSPAPRRASSTTPMQALALFNHQFTIEMANTLAERVMGEALADGTESSGGHGRLNRLFAICLGRQPLDAELAVLKPLVDAYGLRAACRAILNSNEFLYVD